VNVHGSIRKARVGWWITVGHGGTPDPSSGLDVIDHHRWRLTAAGAARVLARWLRN
jgi:hypothetical protein